MIERLVKFQEKNKFLLLILVILFTGFALNYASNLKIETDFGALVPFDSEFNTNDRLIKNAFGSQDVMVLLVRPNRETIIQNPIIDMRDDRIQEYFSYVDDVFEESQYVESVSGPIFSDDYEYAQFLIIINTPQSVGGFRLVKQDLDLYLDEIGSPPGVEVSVTGFPSLLDRVSQLLITDNLSTILITFVFIFFILFWYSRNVVFTLILMSTPILSIITLAAVMVILGINVTITLAAVGILVLGLGVDYSIHIATHYHKAKEEGLNHIKALIRTLDELKIPITASFMTTFAGFSALLFGVSPSSQDQGQVLSLGIAIIYALSFTAFPILMTSFAKHLDFKVNPQFDKVVSVLEKIAIIQARGPKKVFLAVGIITVIMLYGASQVQFSTSNSNWIPENDEVSESFRELNRVYGETDSITIIFVSTKGDLRNTQTIQDIQYMEELLLQIPNVDRVDSPFSDLSSSQNEIYNDITNTNLRDEFSYDYTVSSLRIISRNLQNDDAGNSVVLQDMRNIVNRYPVHNTDVKLYGDPVRFEELGSTLEADAGVTTMISLALVFLCVSIVYASFKIGLISLIPIIIAVLWAVGLMGFFKVPFTTLSTSIISLVLGVGVDFSIHLVDSIKRYMKKNSLENSISKALGSSGAAILLSSVTTFCGFMSLSFAELLGTQRLGFSLGFSIVAVFFVSIALVPALIGMFESKHKNINKKAVLKTYEY